MNDAHLHLQDIRFLGIDPVIEAMIKTGVSRCIVNGTSPEDWEVVEKLYSDYTELVIPSYGLHPWNIPCRDDGLKNQLTELVKKSSLPCIGECGLDRWMNNHDKEAQEDAFLFQLELARQLNASISIHILMAWGWFMDILRNNEFPERGFLLHSYNGPKELLAELIDRGAYFSFSGYYLHERKVKQQEVFKEIPLDRLLVETDAPDMLPPQHVITHPMGELNHPANLPSIATHLAELLGLDFKTLDNQLDRNFSDFFLKR